MTSWPTRQRKRERKKPKRMARWFKKRWQRVAVVTALSLVVLAVAVQVFLSVYLEPILERKLKSTIVSGSDGLLRVDVDKLSFNVFSGNLKLKGLRIEVDSNRFRELQAAHALPATTFEADIPSCAANIKVIPLIFSGQLRVDKIRIDDADLNLCHHAILQDTTDHLTLLQQADYESVSIGSVRLENMSCTYSSSDTANAMAWHFDSCQVALSDIRSDTLGTFIPHDISIHLRNARFLMADSLYKISARSINYTSDNKLLEVEEFSYLPSLSREEFHRKTNAQRNVNLLSIKEAWLANFSLTSLLQGEQFQADSLYLKASRFEIFNDTLPAVGDTTVKEYPAQLLANAVFGARIKAVKAVDGSIIYTERDPATGLDITVDFVEVNGIISNVTNDRSDIAKDSMCVAELTSRVIDGAQAHAVFRFNLNSDAAAFEADIDVTGITATQLDPLTPPMAPVRVHSFVLDAFHANIRGDERHATASVQMLYHDLVLDVSPNKGSNDEGGLKNVAAAILAVWPDNPMKNGKLRAAGHVYRSRVSRSFFNLIWKTMLDGVKEIALREPLKETFLKVLSGPKGGTRVLKGKNRE